MFLLPVLGSRVLAVGGNELYLRDSPFSLQDTLLFASFMLEGEVVVATTISRKRKLVEMMEIAPGAIDTNMTEFAPGAADTEVMLRQQRPLKCFPSRRDDGWMEKLGHVYASNDARRLGWIDDGNPRNVVVHPELLGRQMGCCFQEG
ncbi:hypothetical protein VNO78_20519 [Psophocarpus tetragonolobus]|uniref:Uncharacterized protein n=1 Tax=Psophocarpus tetragonolobus TaxID=3891 RepID=A0AAN9XGT9_PSOTE